MNVPDARFLRKDISLASDPGPDTHRRHARRAGGPSDAVPLLLAHGGGPGGHWASAYATTRGDNLSRSIVLNCLYGVDAPWTMRGVFEAEDRPGEFDRDAGACGLRTGPSLLRGRGPGVSRGREVS